MEKYNEMKLAKNEKNLKTKSSTLLLQEEWI